MFLQNLIAGGPICSPPTHYLTLRLPPEYSAPFIPSLTHSLAELVMGDINKSLILNNHTNVSEIF